MSPYYYITWEVDIAIHIFFVHVFGNGISITGFSCVLGFSLALGLDEDALGEYFKQYDTLSSAVFIRYPEMDDYPNVIKADDGTELGNI